MRVFKQDSYFWQGQRVFSGWGIIQKKQERVKKRFDLNDQSTKISINISKLRDFQKKVRSGTPFWFSE